MDTGGRRRDSGKVWFMISSLCFCAFCVSVVIGRWSTTETQRTQRSHRGRTATLLLVVLLSQSFFPVFACGPETIKPIFVFKGSPDLPFEEFAKGKVGILQSTFGRKTLVIAHRYLNGGTFTEDEQRGLVAALKGKPPEQDDDKAIKAWVAARKEVVGDQEATPAIYDERRHSGYDFFPNCTRNAFEVATQTLKDRVSSHGSDDRNVRDWLRAQDVVFQNCAEGSLAPPESPVGGPQWLQKDRDYQIAAAHFYSLNFKEARSRFARIAVDNESDWQETARYLVGRTLVREASLTEDEKAQRALYEQAEAELINIMAHGGGFQNASKRLLGLVKYRLRPEERVRELAQTLAEQSGNENVRQDVIDYTWLLDKFDAQVQKEEEERKQKLNPTPTPTPYKPDPAYQARDDAIQRGELIEFYFSAKKPDGEADYSNSKSLSFKSDVTEAEVFQYVEIELGRKLTPAETKNLKDSFASALSRRLWLLSPNRKVESGRDYDGCEGSCNETPLESFPEFLRTDELSDWILTFQSEDPKAYGHAYAKWRATGSQAWLSLALTKANKSLRSLARLMREAEQVAEDAPAFPTVAYHLVRLYVGLDRTADAERLVDAVLSRQFELLPVSSQNLFLEQRMKLAKNLVEFLKFAGRKPAAFYEYGTIGRITDLLQSEKGLWDPEYYKETKDEHDKTVEERFKQFLPWDGRKAFDPDTVDIINWHFSLRTLLAASRSYELPEYLKRSLALAAWTRAVILKNEAVAQEASRDVARLAPEMSSSLTNYLNMQTHEQREDEALYIMLKFPNLSPYVPSGIPEFSSIEESEYYFELSWWCKPDETEYNDDGDEIPKSVQSPRFLSAPALAAAKRERVALSTIGDAKSFLGTKVLEWAARSPKEPRIPEAIYIAALANQSYKYGCGGWEQDEEKRTALEKLLKDKYPQSPWAAKLEDVK